MFHLILSQLFVLASGAAQEATQGVAQGSADENAFSVVPDLEVSEIVSYLPAIDAAAARQVSRRFRFLTDTYFEHEVVITEKQDLRGIRFWLSARFNVPFDLSGSQQAYHRPDFARLSHFSAPFQEMIRRNAIYNTLFDARVPYDLDWVERMTTFKQVILYIGLVGPAQVSPFVDRMSDIDLSNVAVIIQADGDWTTCLRPILKKCGKIEDASLFTEHALFLLTEFGHKIERLEIRMELTDEIRQEIICWVQANRAAGKLERTVTVDERIDHPATYEPIWDYVDSIFERGVSIKASDLHYLAKFPSLLYLTITFDEPVDINVLSPLRRFIKRRPASLKLIFNGVPLSRVLPSAETIESLRLFSDREVRLELKGCEGSYDLSFIPECTFYLFSVDQEAGSATVILPFRLEASFIDLSNVTVEERPVMLISRRVTLKEYHEWMELVGQADIHLSRVTTDAQLTLLLARLPPSLQRLQFESILTESQYMIIDHFRRTHPEVHVSCRR
jgi:hypothetical protein